MRTELRIPTVRRRSLPAWLRDRSSRSLAGHRPAGLPERRRRVCSARCPRGGRRRPRSTGAGSRRGPVSGDATSTGTGSSRPPPAAGARTTRAAPPSAGPRRRLRAAARPAATCTVGSQISHDATRSRTPANRSSSGSGESTMERARSKSSVGHASRWISSGTWKNQPLGSTWVACASRAASRRGNQSATWTFVVSDGLPDVGVGAVLPALAHLLERRLEPVRDHRLVHGLEPGPAETDVVVELQRLPRLPGPGVAIGIRRGLERLDRHLVAHDVVGVRVAAVLVVGGHHVGAEPAHDLHQRGRAPARAVPGRNSRRAAAEAGRPRAGRSRRSPATPASRRGSRGRGSSPRAECWRCRPGSPDGLSGPD